MKDARVTRVGDDNWIMGYVHLAHDCQIGNSTVLANSTQLAGHVHIGDWAILGGFTGVHQFVRIGAHTMIGGGTMLRQDVPPYVTVAGNPPKAFGVNSEGLRRRGVHARDDRGNPGSLPDAVPRGPLVCRRSGRARAHGGRPPRADRAGRIPPGRDSRHRALGSDTMPKAAPVATLGCPGSRGLSGRGD